MTFFENNNHLGEGIPGGIGGGGGAPPGVEPTAVWFCLAGSPLKVNVFKVNVFKVNVFKVNVLRH